MQVKKQQLEQDMEQWIGSNLGKEFIQVYIVILLNAGLDEAQVGIKISGRNINNHRCADNSTFMAESEDELQSLLMKVKDESEMLA